MENVDTLIYAGWVIPVEPDNTVYSHHAVAIQDGKIVDIVPSDEAAHRFLPRITHRLPTHVLMPGMVNTHTHAAMTLLRGFADDLPLNEWLTQHIWPAEAACVSPEFIIDGTQLAIAEMLRAGVTCFNDMYFFPDTMAEVVEKTGIRATIGLIVLDFPTAWAANADEYLQKAQVVHDKYQDNPLIQFALAPHAPYTVSDEPLIKAKALVDKWQVPMHIHVHETAHEVDEAVKNQGERPLSRLHKLGLVDSSLLNVHATQLEQDEIELLAKQGAHVVHCPESNLKLASGFCPVDKLLKAGVNVALGTDGTASNNDLDMLGEMRTAALLSKGISGNASSVPAHEALRMATLNGAKALGIDDVTGSLEIGKSADIVALDMQTLETMPMYDPISQIVYATSRDKVSDVWVAGEHLLKSRALTRIDIHELMSKVTAWREKVDAAVEAAANQTEK
ncbi:TRZ/ATZ family hydrolase [Candidatus Albibeggiatoa sp. nov. NOAA]|uniref:TRZ/ATZ family hydrolase n=1 Tax=Candidatus Albibeggiatoa sp. nov. NOAA TaxID=3162724 RepID=UPI0032F38301|nr:TRZ/ATZ family hydrolase [Thiotrichaceae bacterium]